MHSADASPPDAPARQLRDSLARGLRTEPTVRLAWLFGSRARDLDAFRRWALGKLDAG